MIAHGAVTIALHTERPISAQAVRHLYDLAAWWPNRTLDAITTVLAHDIAVGVWHQDDLVGFARAITDTVFRAYIEDVIIHPSYRKLGLAISMVNYLRANLSHIDTISLFCSPELVPLYERLGFQARHSQVVLHRTDM